MFEVVNLYEATSENMTDVWLQILIKKEYKMIFNKELGISEDDISVEDDLQTLAYWRDALNAQLTSILNRFDVDYFIYSS